MTGESRTVAGYAGPVDSGSQHALGIIRCDWLVSRSWNRLHFADLSPEDAAGIIDDGGRAGPVQLACGRTAAYVCIPGMFTRMGAQRCTGCCRAVGYPPGKGSPKNDEACRAILGLPATPPVPRAASPVTTTPPTGWS